MIDKRQDEPAEKDTKVFDIGDRTIGQMSDQVFAFDEFGTLGTTARSAAIQIATEVPADTTLRRVERKLDVAMRAIAAIQRRVDSIDNVLARVIHRG